MYCTAPLSHCKGRFISFHDDDDDDDDDDDETRQICEEYVMDRRNGESN